MVVMTDLFQTIALFANRWVGTAIPKLFLLFLGILLCIVVVAAIWDRRIKIFSASIAISLGILLMAIALWGSFAVALGGIDADIRIRSAVVLVSICAIALTVRALTRTGMHPRYGLLWSAVSLLMLLMAIFPKPLEIFPTIFGVNFASTIGALGIIFLLLLVFHFSIVISELRDQQAQLLDRIRGLEHEVLGKSQGGDLDLGNNSVRSTPWRIIAHKILSWDRWRVLTWKTQHGTSLTAPLIILLTISSVVVTGLLAPQVMIGDEVTHYYMMQTQSKDLSTPNFFAEIPTGWGKTETRRYPHSFLWHYLAAVVYKISNGSFAAIQIYQALFLAQLLWVAYLLARSRGGVADRSALLYLLLIASLPMVLIFSVAFYQDVPVTAQVLTAFYLLRRGRWLPATFFLCFAFGIKETAMLFFPAYFVCLLCWTYKKQRVSKAILVLLVSLSLVGGFTWFFGQTIEKYSHAEFYPVQQAEKIINAIQDQFKESESLQNEQHSHKNETSGSRKIKSAPSEKVAQIIANHPGDLRIPANFFIYGGILIYLTLAFALLTLIRRFGWFNRQRQEILAKESSLWLWGCGLSYIILVAYFLRTAPDIRFFLPGLIFCILPLAERLVLLPKPRYVVMVITALALMQAGYSLAKTYHLRHVSPGLQAAIQYLQKHPPVPPRIFMYPEGNYRLFPVPHDWYLNYYLRDFWRADNNKRIVMLRKNAIGDIVIKKHLIATVDEAITDLGVYPVKFVKEIASDSRFKRVFENSEVLIYKVPKE